ncbi:MAG: Transcriptional regulator, AcrR family [Firmicutes bacterium]|nr:Transcriptional regulator, AcrR family [Bacillota bacterium]MDI6705374.1 TetR/AcrR family transcriptional regulator [Bacillota bacterium]
MEKQAEKKPERSSRKIKKILHSAIRLFKEDGYYNVSIEDIVIATNSSTGSFYNYFGSKDELVISYRHELLGHCRNFYSRLQSDAAYADKNALDKLQALTVHVLKLLAAVGEEFGRVFTVHRLKETNAVPEDKPYFPLIMELIEAGQGDKSIRDDYSVREIADIVDFFITGCHIDWQIKRGTYIITDKNAAAINMLFNNISSAAKRKPRQMCFDEIWADAMSRTAQDFRSDIKRLEDQWLERLYGNKPY